MKTRKRVLWLLLVPVAGLFLYWLPLFRIVPLDAAREQQRNKRLQPQAVANELWNDRLQHVMARAVEASELFAAIDRDPTVAKSQYSQPLGKGDVHYYFIKGVGRVVSIDDQEESVGLCLDSEGSAADISVSTGYIFGNAIVDGTKLIDDNDFANSQDFNKVSEEINRIVETRVLPPFRRTVTLGASVRFVGCAKIVDEDTDLHPMHIIPIDLKVQAIRTGT